MLSSFFTVPRWGTKWTSPLQLPISLTLEGLVHFGAKRMSRSDNFPYAFLRIICPKGFYVIGNSRNFLLHNAKRSSSVQNTPLLFLIFPICCPPVPDTDHDLPDAPRQPVPTLYRVFRNCNTGQWKFLLWEGIFPIPRYISDPSVRSDPS